MKHFVALSAFLIMSFKALDNLYVYSIDSYDGVTYSMDRYKGKKILVFILPSSQTEADSLWLLNINSIYLQNADKLSVIGVPSIEDGYIGDVQKNISAWYRSMLDSAILIAKPCYTHKSSNAAQEGLFQWITTADKNGYMDREVSGPCSMYFINENGQLDGSFGPEAKWSNKVFVKMLQ